MARARQIKQEGSFNSDEEKSYKILFKASVEQITSDEREKLGPLRKDRVWSFTHLEPLRSPFRSSNLHITQEDQWQMSKRDADLSRMLESVDESRQNRPIASDSLWESVRQEWEQGDDQFDYDNLDSLLRVNMRKRDQETFADAKEALINFKEQLSANEQDPQRSLESLNEMIRLTRPFYSQANTDDLGYESGYFPTKKELFEMSWFRVDEDLSRYERCQADLSQDEMPLNEHGYPQFNSLSNDNLIPKLAEMSKSSKDDVYKLIKAARSVADVDG